MKRIFIFISCAAMAAAAGAQDQPAPPAQDEFASHFWQLEKINPNEDWTRHFRIGALMGLNIKADFSMSGVFPISGNNPANGIFDDGYVKHDNTGDPGGLTYNWGYNNDNQYDPNAQTLTMKAASSFSATGSSSGSDEPYVGFDLAYGDSYWYWGNAKLGWEFGFGLLPIHIENTESMGATVNQGTYTFNVSNPLGAPIPSAPYQGGPNGPGYQIPDTPAASTFTPVSGGTVSGTHTLDATLYTLRLGPSLYWDLNQHIGLYASAGPAVGIVSGELEYNETIMVSGTTTHNSGNVSSTDVVYGGYVNATFVYHVVENADVYIGAQFMPMSDANFSGGGREADLKLNGQVYITAGINWPF